ncbi:MAG: alanine racemase [Alphaproteobacteria bacterium]
MSRFDRAGAVLTIDLGAIAVNYRRLNERLGGAKCACVVKAGAYGLGMGRVARALARAGCDSFFVATLDEGLRLRRLLNEAEIAVFNGPPPGAEGELVANRLIPVLNDLGDIARWGARAHGHRRLHAILHVDTGMCRLGLPPEAVDRLAAEPERLAGLDVRLVMSHLACADEPESPMNARQLAAFTAARAGLPLAPASLAASSGIFLGAAYHFDVARPGAALYGINPTPGRPNPMAEVVRLQGKIIQVRDVDSPQTVGYGATHRVAGPGRIATVPVGYADGYHRSLSNRAFAYIGNTQIPVVGRVSMDLITLDVSAVPPERSQPGTTVDLIGGPSALDDVAARAGTIGYEILTSLGRRYPRRYVGNTA